MAHAVPRDRLAQRPQRIAEADRKLWQLQVASRVGFDVPETLIGSDWDAILGALLYADDRFIVKMMRGVIAKQERIQAAYTTILTGQLVDQLRATTGAFPGIYQTYLRKAREWRVTVVDEEVYAAAIYTDESAKDDWRKHQNLSGVTFKKADLPAGIEGLCRAYLRSMGLRFGAFDLVEGPQGNITFLECNPNGQYGWIEEQLGFPISLQIARVLASLANIS